MLITAILILLWLVHWLVSLFFSSIIFQEIYSVFTFTIFVVHY